MERSKNVMKWMEQGQIKGQRSTLLKVLQTRFGQVPRDLVRKLENISDTEQLDRLVEVATLAISLEAFRATVPD